MGLALSVVGEGRAGVGGGDEERLVFVLILILIWRLQPVGVPALLAIPELPARARSCEDFVHVSVRGLS